MSKSRPNLSGCHVEKGKKKRFSFCIAAFFLVVYHSVKMMLIGCVYSVRICFPMSHTHSTLHAFTTKGLPFQSSLFSLPTKHTRLTCCFCDYCRSHKSASTTSRRRPVATAAEMARMRPTTTPGSNPGHPLADRA
jgi:hypothetical protein